MKKIYFVSSNQGKRLEIKQILESHTIKEGFEIEFTDLNIPEIQGSGLEIIQDKTSSCASVLKEILVCEDSALCFRAWNDFPGVYIKHVKEAVGTSGLWKMLLPFEDKQGRAECRVGLSVPGKELKIFEGKVEGQIVEPRGAGGFGWDSLFLPEGHDQTYAEMNQDLKNTVSDRFLALMQLKGFLLSNPEWLNHKF